MTEEKAQAFMAATVAMCEDEDGPHFAVVTVKEGGGFTVETPDRRAAHGVQSDQVIESLTVAELATAAGWTPPAG